MESSLPSSLHFIAVRASTCFYPRIACSSYEDIRLTTTWSEGIFSQSRAKTFLRVRKYSRLSIETTSIETIPSVETTLPVSPLYFVALHRKTSIETTPSLEPTVTR